MRGAAATLVAVAVAACASERPRDGVTCPTWREEVAPALAETCSGCHGGAAPAAGYDLTSYLGALGPGSDQVANAIAGDATSAIARVIDPATASEPHAGQGALFALVRAWVVDCDLAYFDSPLHPGGVLDPASADFHGHELRARGWDFAVCASCHGEDFAGTTKAPSCTSCHAEGPTACDTCHEISPTTGAHVTHVTAGLDCTGCHQVPRAWDDDGHILRAGAVDPAPADVTMTGLATITVEPADRPGPPAYDGATATCSAVYCHGDVLGAAGGATTKPRWTDDPPGPPPCSSCHGAPPPSHVDDRCQICHPSGATHLDGTTQLGTGLPGCSGCHGSESSAAPPRDLAGNLFTTALGVGAHQAHLQVPGELRGPVACATCHLVPATVTAPGHVDSLGPAEVVAALGWDRDARTCATAWCHGPARPRWTETGGAGCGTCHGVPPTTAPHTPDMGLTACGTCHPSTMDAVGRILIVDGPDGPTSSHMDGDVDAP